jgi:hypothetical protein
VNRVAVVVESVKSVPLIRGGNIIRMDIQAPLEHLQIVMGTK